MSPRSAEASDGVAFLTALLIRFPELGSATLGPRLGEIRLEFYLDQEIDTVRFSRFVDKFRMSWDLFFDLVRAETSERRITRVVDYPTETNEHDSDVEIIRVTRDLETLSLEELSMVVGLIRERFLASLIEGEPVPAAESKYQEQVLLRSLDKVRSDPYACGLLTGFRDEMRVLVYANDSPETAKTYHGKDH
jgi:hypothetical protein